MAVPKWSEVVASDKYQSLPAAEKAKFRDIYWNNVYARLPKVVALQESERERLKAAFYAQGEDARKSPGDVDPKYVAGTPEEAEARKQDEGSASTAKPRSAGETFTDFGRTVTQAASLGTQGLFVDTPKLVETSLAWAGEKLGVISRKEKEDEYARISDYYNPMQDAMEKSRKRLDKGKSEEQQRQLSNIEAAIKEGGVGNVLSSLMDNKAGAIDLAAQSLADTFIGGAAGKVKYASKYKKVMEILKDLPEEFAKKKADSAAKKAAMATGVTVEAAQSAAHATAGHEAEMAKLTDEQLSGQSPRFTELVSEGVPSDKARKILAAEAGLSDALGSGAGTLVGGLLFKPAGHIAAIFAGQATRDAAQQSAKKGILETVKAAGREVPTAMARESGQEFTQSGAEAIGGNIAAQQTYDAKRGAFDGAAEQAALGAVLGNITGGGMQSVANAAGIAGNGLDRVEGYVRERMHGRRTADFSSLSDEELTAYRDIVSASTDQQYAGWTAKEVESIDAELARRSPAGQSPAAAPAQAAQSPAAAQPATAPAAAAAPSSAPQAQAAVTPTATVAQPSAQPAEPAAAPAAPAAAPQAPAAEQPADAQATAAEQPAAAPEPSATPEPSAGPAVAPEQNPDINEIVDAVAAQFGDDFEPDVDMVRDTFGVDFGTATAIMIAAREKHLQSMPGLAGVSARANADAASQRAEPAPQVPVAPAAAAPQAEGQKPAAQQRDEADFFLDRAGVTGVIDKQTRTVFDHVRRQMENGRSLTGFDLRQMFGVPETRGQQIIAAAQMAVSEKAAVEAAGMAAAEDQSSEPPKQEITNEAVTSFHIGGRDPKRVSYRRADDGRLFREIEYEDGEKHSSFLVTKGSPDGDEMWVSSGEYGKGNYWPVQVSSADIGGVILRDAEDLGYKPDVAATHKAESKPLQQADAELQQAEAEAERPTLTYKPGKVSKTSGRETVYSEEDGQRYTVELPARPGDKFNAIHADENGGTSSAAFGTMLEAKDYLSRRRELVAERKSLQSHVGRTWDGPDGKVEVTGVEIRDGQPMLATTVNGEEGDFIRPDALEQVIAEDEAAQSEPINRRHEDRRHEDKPVTENRRHGGRRVADLTEAEAKHALLTNPLSGLPNKTAFEEDADLDWPFVAAMDIDGFGFLNDVWGHNPVDEILKQIGSEIASFVSDDVRIYHRSGDEFAARGKDKRSLESALKAMQEHLEGVIFKVPDVPRADGKMVTLQKTGIGVTYGIDSDYERADNRANESKEQRKAAGNRSPKGTNPGGMAEILPGGVQADLGERGVSKEETLQRRVSSDEQEQQQAASGRGSEQGSGANAQRTAGDAGAEGGGREVQVPAQSGSVEDAVRQGVVSVPEAISKAIEGEIKKAKESMKRARKEREKQKSKDGAVAAIEKEKAAEDKLRRMRLNVFGAEDLALKAMYAKDPAMFAGPVADLFPDTRKALDEMFKDSSGKLPAKDQAVPVEKKSQRVIGKNKDGLDVYEDERGVRSVVEDGMRRFEAVGFKPGGGIVISNRRDDYKTVEELAEENKPEEAQKPAASKNTVFTEDAAAKARELLRRKLGPGTVGANAPLDPEILQAGITLAGYHIENGARTFAAYAKAMIEDLGDVVSPFLKSWYMGVKYDPRAAAFDGMDSAAAVEQFDLKTLAKAAQPDAVADDAVRADTEQAKAPQEQAQEPENGNAIQELDSAGPAALAGAPAEPVQGAEGKRKAGSGAQRGSRGDGRGNAGSGGRRVRPGAGVGDDAGAASVPARGAEPGRDGIQGGLFDGARDQPDDGGPGQRVEPPQFSPVDFRIEEDLTLGEGGDKTKYQRNVAAIRLLKQLDAADRNATPEEQRTLALYVGWGGLPGAFDPENQKWSREYAELKALLDEEEYAAARESTQYAHYTSREIVQGIYSALERLGFTGGKVLEAGGGVGNFIGLMPEGMRTAGRFTLVERERIAAGIARHLYPKQNVQMADFTEFGKGDDGAFDAQVGNPPFSRTSLTDKSGRKHLSGLRIHNYFIAKGIDMLRDGGIQAVVVSNGFLDSADDRARVYIGERARFLGAVRLPNNAFSKNAGTEVTTDIVFFQKLPESEWGSLAARKDMKRWVDTVNVADPRGGEAIKTNRYYAENPRMLLGEWTKAGTMYGPDQPALVSRPGQDTGKLLQEALKNLPAGIYQSAAEMNTKAVVEGAVEALHDTTVSEGGHYEHNGKLWRRLPDSAGERRAVELTPDTQWTEKTKLGDKGFARIKGMAGIRKTLRSLIAAEMSGDSAMEDLRKQLNKQYDAYVKEHGLLNESSSSRYFADDPDYPLLSALEFNFEPGLSAAAAKAHGVSPTKAKANKAPIFSQRVIEDRKPVERAASPQDALNISMAERGRIDASYIAKLLGRDADGVLEEMAGGERPLLFKDPATNEYVLRDAYLSGNVRKKLKQARQAGMVVNALELEKVLPKDVGAGQISVRIGAPWIPPGIYEDFAKHLLGEGTSAKLAYVPLNSSFSGTIIAGSDIADVSTYGIPQYRASSILMAMLNNRAIKVTDKLPDGSTITLKDETEAANDKSKDIRDKFEDWLFSDADRSDVLVRAYNDANNNYVTRVYDGSWLTFPGKVPSIKFRRHQRNFVARVLQDRTALADHVVGAGKTFSAIAAAIELKRTGLARKPMICVPNHLVKQWAADFYRLYPGAKILTATKKDFERQNRRRFLGKIATGDWDAVVIAHSSFGFIKPSADFEITFNEKQIEKIMAAIRSAEADGGKDMASKRTIKQLEAMKERLDNRISRLRDKPMDDLLDLEQLGVDQLFVDEAHMFKNLMFSTKMQNIRGLGDSNGSQRAYDMFIKINQLYAKNGRGQGVVFLTGTPVSNSLAEMYHMMRYMMPDVMESSGFGSFDAWANTFAAVEDSLKTTAAGTTKNVKSFEKFYNTYELLAMYDQVADTVTMEDIKAAFREENGGREFPLPKLKTGKRQPISLDRTDSQVAYMKEIAARTKAVEGRKGPPKKGEDNHLSIAGDARKAAMDIRLVDISVTEREKGARIDRAAEEIVSRYKKWDEHKGTQLVFSDLGTPIKHAKKDLAEYQALQERIRGGTDEDTVNMASLGDEDAMAKVEDAEKAQAELEEKGNDWLDAIRAAERGFSVYDDLKAALIERGIPESEIAFIHDYNTDDQKAALFKKVNAGTIRVMLGSTQKMGAGTNVQDRLVALHHLDIPWKPSDVEQREGRIVRQGNLFSTPPTEEKPNPLYMPDFEVEILAYATKDTFDRNMWEIQEKKLRGINQLRSRQIDREIENSFDEMEMSASEMQAAATGNIYLLKEIQLSNEIKKLERKKRSFDAQKADIATRIKQAERNIASLPEKIKTVERLVDGAKAYEEALAKSKAAIRVEINGQTYTDRSSAAEKVRELIDAKVKTDDGKEKPVPLDATINGERFTNRQKMADFFLDIVGDVEPILWTHEGKTYNRVLTAEKAIMQAVADAIAEESTAQVGSLGGVPVSIEAVKGKYGNEVIVYVGADRDSQVSAEVSEASGDDSERRARDTATKIIRTASNLLRHVPTELNYLKGSLERAKAGLEDAKKATISGEWPDQSKLDELRAKHKEVMDILRADKKEDGEEPAKFKASPSAAAGIPVREAQRLLNRAGASVKAVPSYADLPEGIRREAELQGIPPSDVKAAHWKGRSWLVAENVTSDDVLRAALHEGMHGHLRKAYGRQVGAVMEDLASRLPGKGKPSMRVMVMAQAQGIDLSDYVRGLNSDTSKTDRQKLSILTEELLTHLEEGRATVTGRLKAYLQAVVGAIRNFLRKHRFAEFAEYGVTDLQHLMRQARLYGESIAEAGGEPVFQAAWRDGAVEILDKHVPKFSLSPETKEAYEKRIDALLSGAASSPQGVKILDRSDVLGLLGYPDLPVHIAEGKVLAGQDNHHLTAEHWKKIPEWLENPVAVFDSDTVPGSLVLLSPEAINGAPVMMIVRPNTNVGRIDAHLLVNAYDKDRGKPPISRWVGEGLLRYLDQRKSPAFGTDTGLQLPKSVHQARGRNGKILTGADLFKYRQSQGGDAAGKAGDTPSFSLKRHGIDAQTEPHNLRGGLKRWFANRLHSDRTFNRWWHSFPGGLGTQYHKATVDPHFRRAYKIGQEYIADVARSAGDAMDVAPTVLGRMDTVKDWGRDLTAIFKSKAAAADMEAVSKAIYSGTLVENREFSPEELREKFGLTPKQIGLYREFRAAIRVSLESLAKAEILDALRIRNALPASVLNMARSLDVSLSDYQSFLTAAFKEQAKRLKRELALLDENNDPEGKQREILMKAIRDAVAGKSRMTYIANRVEKLLSEGYAPLMRFGDYTVMARNDKGEVIHFSMHETQAEANEARETLRELLPPDHEVTSGIRSDKGHELFRGVTPETIGLFGDKVGMANDERFQEYLKQAVSNRSALKRLIHRKETPGFNWDAQRSLAAFVTSNARRAAQIEHLGRMVEAIDSIPKAKGDVRDEAIKLRDYLTNPSGEAQTLRAFMFTYYIAGSIASAAVNLTQPVTMTYPYLSQWGRGRAAEELRRALMDSVKSLKSGAVPADVADAIHKAKRDGHVDPQNIYNMMALAEGNLTADSAAGRSLKAINHALALPFSQAEALNRKATFIAAYRIGRGLSSAQLKKARVRDAYEFAVKAVAETQGVYNRGNRPNWARGAAGATLLTFKQFMISYVEFIKRLWDEDKLSAMIALGILYALAGLMGMPFAQDVEDLAGAFLVRIGVPENPESWLRDKATELLGEEGRDSALYGVASTILGVDVHGRLGMGNLVPATNALDPNLKDGDRLRSVMEAAGPAGGLVSSIWDAAGYIGRGDAAKAAQAAIPVAFKNVAKGAEMLRTGQYLDKNGRPVMDVTPTQAVGKMLGFQPLSVAQETRRTASINARVSIQRGKEDYFADRMAQAVVDKDNAALKRISAEVAEWNKDHPESPVRLSRDQIRRRVVDMKTLRSDRIERRVPKEMRKTVEETR